MRFVRLAHVVHNDEACQLLDFVGLASAQCPHANESPRQICVGGRVEHKVVSLARRADKTIHGKRFHGPTIGRYDRELVMFDLEKCPSFTIGSITPQAHIN